MNGPEVASNLEKFIKGNAREWFGPSAIQRDCKVSYNQGCRIIELGIKKGLFVMDPNKPFRAKMADDAPL